MRDRLFSSFISIITLLSRDQFFKFSLVLDYLSSTIIECSPAPEFYHSYLFLSYGGNFVFFLNHKDFVFSFDFGAFN